MLADLGGGDYLRYLHEGSFDRLDDSHDVIFRELLLIRNGSCATRRSCRNI